MSPLSHARVLVTRPVEDADDLAHALARAGLTPVVAPMIARVPTPDAVRDAVDACPRPDVLLLTSPAAARALAGAPPLAPARVACVGPGTATAARELGFHADIVPEDATGEAAVEALGPLGGATVLWVQPGRPTPATRRALDRAGAKVVDAVAYKTVPHPDRHARLVAAGALDAVTLTAPSVAHAYADARSGAPNHGAPALVVIGPSTATACEQTGLPVDEVAHPHTVEGLVAAVLRALR